MRLNLVSPTDCGQYCAAQHQKGRQRQSKAQDQTISAPTSARSSHPSPATLFSSNHLLHPSHAYKLQQEQTPVTPSPSTPADDQTHNGPASAPAGHIPPEYMDPDTDYDTAPESNEPETRPILFYHRHEPHFGFTNFSDHPVEYHGRVYPTSEHLFQSFKVRFSHRLTLTASAICLSRWSVLA